MMVPSTLETMIDSTALDGLKGWASIYIMCFHLFMRRGLDLCGSVMLSFFFLLSGFCLVLGYGKTQWDGCTVVFVKKEGKLLDSRKFYLKRFTRIGPLYYLTNIVCYYAYSMRGINTIITIPSIIYTVTMTNSWSMTYLVDQTIQNILPFNQQAWFITTLIPFYAVFPLILPTLQALSSSKLSSLLGILFYVQCLPIIFNNMAATNNRLLDPLFYWSTGAHPLSRFPVFMMGMVAGVLRLRGTSHPVISPFILNIFHDILPWHTAYQEDTENTSLLDLSLVLIVLYTIKWFFLSFSSQLLFIYALVGGMIVLYWVWTIFRASSLITSWLCYNNQQQRWSIRVNMNMIFLITIFLMKIILHGKVRDYYNWNYVGQFLCVHVMAIIIFGLTADGGRSVVGAFFRLRVSRFLGRISMAVYLLHIPVSLYCEHYLYIHTYYLTHIGTTMAATLVISTIYTLALDEPLQNILRKYI